MEYPKFKVCCRCFTFNHSKYITDTMNGFTMQQTSFPFVCCIVDDASTDGEQEVIRKYVEENFDFSEGSVAYHKETDYAHITYAQHKTNKNCYFAVLYLKENHYSQRKPKMQYLEEWRGMCEYEALCEGDDYWIVPDKLEKQVIYLDNNPDCSLCFTNAYVNFDMKGHEDVFKDLYNHLEEKDYEGTEILERWSIPTASVVYKNGIITPKDKRFLYGDIVLFLTAFTYGRLHCINERMVCYRRNVNGASVKKQNYKKMVEHYTAIEEHFGKEYEIIVKKHKAKCLIMWFLSGHLKKESWTALHDTYKEGLVLLFIILFFPVLYKVIK